MYVCMCKIRVAHPQIDDVGVRERAHDAHFALELLERLALLGRVAQIELLHCHHLPLVLTQIDNAETALSGREHVSKQSRTKRVLCVYSVV